MLLDRRTRYWAAILCWLLVSGCGPASQTANYADAEPALNASAIDVARSASASGSQNPLASGKLTSLQALPTENPAANRKIIYNAHISVETPDIDLFSSQLDAKLAELDGFIANFSERRYSGDRQTGTWTLRVAAANFAALLTWLDNETHVTRKEVTSQDMTEEFLDLAARAENKRNTEKRLTATLAEQAGSLEDILAMEREIDRVREEIERIEGRRRYLSERVSLSTITLAASTRSEYQSPKQAVFGTRVSQTWSESVSDLRNTAEHIAIGIVGVAPWLPILLALMAMAYFVLRIAWQRFARMAFPEQRPIAASAPAGTSAPAEPPQI